MTENSQTNPLLLLLESLSAPDFLCEIVEADKLGVAALAGLRRGGQCPEAIGALLGAAALLLLASRSDETRPEEILEILSECTCVAVEDILRQLHARAQNDQTPDHIRAAPLQGLRIASFLKGMSQENTIADLTPDDLVALLDGPIKIAAEAVEARGAEIMATHSAGGTPQ